MIITKLIKETSLHYLAAFLLGIILVLAFAPANIFPLAIFAPAGLLLLWLKHAQSLRHTFGLGLVFGWGLFGAGIPWVYTSVHVFGDVPVFFALLITFGLITILASYPAVTGYCLNRFFPNHYWTKWLYAFPALWVFSEWIRGWFLTGFPWLFLGYSQTVSPLKGYATLSGVYAVSLMVVLSSGLLVNALLNFQQKKLRNVYISLILLALIWLVGEVFSMISWTKAQNQPVSIALVQGNISQSIKWNVDQVQHSLDQYTDLTQPLLGKNKIIIWPESAVPLPLQNATSFIDELDQKAKAKGSTIILGIPIRARNGSYYNAVVTLGEAKKQVYLKRHLVPFGEYVPFSQYLSQTLQFMKIPMSDMIPGAMEQNPLIVDHLKILPSICYEITFPELTRINPDPDINLLLVLTNDAWFGKSAAQAQHLQMAAMRAIEFRKPVLTVTNDGITAIIDANGKIQQTLPQRKTVVLQTRIQPFHGLTPWVIHGVTPLLILLFYLLWIARRCNKAIIALNEPERKTYGRTL